MKKLISSTLALTMLVTPLMGSACFADTAQEPNVHYVQNENRSEPFKEKKCDSQKTRKILAGVTAGTIALTGVTAATLKHFEDKLPESLKVKFPFLFTKKAQETQENIKTEKIPETVTETETTKDETIETAVTESEVSKNQTVETVTADSNITKNETIKTVAVDSNITKNETADIEAIKAKIIQSLAKNNTTNNTNDTNWLSTIGNVLNSAQAKYVIALIGCAALTPLVFLGGYKARKAVNNFLAKRKGAAAATVAADAAAPLVAAGAPVAAARKVKFLARTIVNGKTVLKEMADDTFKLFGKEASLGFMTQLLQAGSVDALCNSIIDFEPTASKHLVTALAELVFQNRVENDPQATLNNILTPAK